MRILLLLVATLALLPFEVEYLFPAVIAGLALITLLHYLSVYRERVALLAAIFSFILALVWLDINPLVKMGVAITVHAVYFQQLGGKAKSARHIKFILLVPVSLLTLSTSLYFLAYKPYLLASIDKLRDHQSSLTDGTQLEFMSQIYAVDFTFDFTFIGLPLLAFTTLLFGFLFIRHSATGFSSE